MSVLDHFIDTRLDEMYMYADIPLYGRTRKEREYYPEYVDKNIYFA